jgi:hypothetical protein
MFLKLESFFLKPQTPAAISLFNGTFEKSENAISRDRMLDVCIAGPGSERVHPDTSQWRESGGITRLDFKTGGEGTMSLAFRPNQKSSSLPRKISTSIWNTTACWMCWHRAKKKARWTKMLASFTPNT